MKLILLCTVIVSVATENDERYLQSWWWSDPKMLQNNINIQSNMDKLNNNAGNVSTCECGWRNSGRIVGGKSTRRNEYPWMVLLVRGEYKCGGSIITEYHVLTAAHCTDGAEPHQIKILLGKHNVLNAYEGIMRSVARIIQHKNFSENPVIVNDIAVLLTTKKIKFTGIVGPVCLPNKRLDLAGKQIKVTGWGISEGTGNGNILRELDLIFVPLEICSRLLPPGRILKDTMICAFGDGKDSCTGDSGGPLVYLNENNNRYIQIALVSYGHLYCRSEAPSINTDVFYFMDWIISAISESKKGVKACAGN